MKKLILSYIILLLLSANSAMAYGNNYATDARIYSHLSENFENLEYETKLITCSLTQTDYTGFQHSVTCIKFRQVIQKNKNMIAKQLKERLKI